MKTAIAAALLLAAPAAWADLVEWTLSGSTAASDGYFAPGMPGTLQEFAVDWSIVIVYEDTNAMGYHDAPVVEAYMVVDGVRRDFDGSWDPNASRENRQTLSAYPFDGAGIQGQLFFDLGMNQAAGFELHAEILSGDFFPSSFDGDISSIPVGYSADDFDMISIQAYLGDAIADSQSDAWSRGGEWFLYADHASARVIPAPSALLAFGALGLTAARRRR